MEGALHVSAFVGSVIGGWECCLAAAASHPFVMCVLCRTVLEVCKECGASHGFTRTGTDTEQQLQQQQQQQQR